MATLHALTKIIVTAALAVLVSCKPSNKSLSSDNQVSDSMETIRANISGLGQIIELQMVKGKSHNHPSFVFWMEDTSGNLIQTLFITQSIGKGVFTYGDKSSGKWKPGEVHRPAALPYWAHKAGLLDNNGKQLTVASKTIPDACTGPTPSGSFRLTTATEKLVAEEVVLMFEINQPWDWNTHWHNNLYPDDADYKTSCQPALVYSARLNLSKTGNTAILKPIGYSHHSGKDGSLNYDLSSFTTALDIVKELKAVTVSKQ